MAMPPQYLFLLLLKSTLLGFLQLSHGNLADASSVLPCKLQNVALKMCLAGIESREVVVRPCTSPTESEVKISPANSTSASLPPVSMVAPIERLPSLAAIATADLQEELWERLAPSGQIRRANSTLCLKATGKADADTMETTLVSLVTCNDSDPTQRWSTSTTSLNPRLVHVDSGNCLETRWNSRRAFAFHCDDHTPFQRWTQSGQIQGKMINLAMQECLTVVSMGMKTNSSNIATDNKVVADKCLTDPDSSGAHGNDDSNNLQWQLWERLDDDSIAHSATGKCLQLRRPKGNRTTARVVMRTCDGSEDQKWLGNLYVISKTTNLCLQMNSKRVIFAGSCWHSNHFQMWSRDGLPTSSHGNNNTRYFHNVQAGKCLEAFPNRTVVMAKCKENNNSNMQLWYGDETGFIRHLATGHCLSSNDSGHVSMELCWTNDQKWSAGPVIVHRTTKLCLVAATDNSSNVVKTSPCDPTDYQYWSQRHPNIPGGNSPPALPLVNQATQHCLETNVYGDLRTSKCDRSLDQKWIRSGEGIFHHFLTGWCLGSRGNVVGAVSCYDGLVTEWSDPPHLINKQSNLALEATTNFSVHMATPEQGKRSQMWTHTVGEIPMPTNAATLKNIKSGQCVTSTADGVVAMAACNMTEFQTWDIVVGGKSSQIKSALTNLCLSMTRENSTRRVLISTTTCSMASDPGQQWTLIGPFITSNQGECLAVNGNTLTLQNCSSNQTGQMFTNTVLPQRLQPKKMRNFASGKCMEVSSTSSPLLPLPSSTVQVFAGKCDHDNHWQNWIENPDGSLTNFVTSQCLQMNNKGIVSTGECSHSNQAQKWFGHPDIANAMTKKCIGETVSPSNSSHPNLVTGMPCSKSPFQSWSSFVPMPTDVIGASQLINVGQSVDVAKGKNATTTGGGEKCLSVNPYDNILVMSPCDKTQPIQFWLKDAKGRLVNVAMPTGSVVAATHGRNSSSEFQLLLGEFDEEGESKFTELDDSAFLHLRTNFCLSADAKSDRVTLQKCAGDSKSRRLQSWTRNPQQPSRGRLRDVASQLCLQATQRKTLQLDNCHGNNGSNKAEIWDTVNTYNKGKKGEFVTLVKNRQTGLCLGYTTNGTTVSPHHSNITMTSCNATKNIGLFHDDGPLLVATMPGKSGDRKFCLKQQEKAGKLKLDECDSGSNFQLWTPDGIPPHPHPSQQLHNPSRNTCLEGSWDGTVQHQQCRLGNPNQRWTLPGNPQPGACFHGTGPLGKIVHLPTGKCLSMTKNGSVGLETCASSSWQNSKSSTAEISTFSWKQQHWQGSGHGDLINSRWKGCLAGGVAGGVAKGSRCRKSPSDVWDLCGGGGGGKQLPLPRPILLINQQSLLCLRGNRLTGRLWLARCSWRKDSLHWILTKDGRVRNFGSGDCVRMDAQGNLAMSLCNQDNNAAAMETWTWTTSSQLRNEATGLCVVQGKSNNHVELGNCELMLPRQMWSRPAVQVNLPDF